MSNSTEEFVLEIKSIKLRHGSAFFKKKGLHAVLLDFNNNIDKKYLNILQNADTLLLPERLSKFKSAELNQIDIDILKNDFIFNSGLDHFFSCVVFDAYLYGLDLKKNYSCDEYKNSTQIISSQKIRTSKKTLIQDNNKITRPAKIIKNNTSPSKTSFIKRKSYFPISNYQRRNPLIYKIQDLIIQRKILSPLFFLVIVWILNFSIQDGLFLISCLFLSWFLFYHTFRLGISDEDWYSRHGVFEADFFDDPLSFLVSPFTYVTVMWYEQVPIIFLSYKILEITL